MKRTLTVLIALLLLLAGCTPGTTDAPSASTQLPDTATPEGDGEAQPLEKGRVTYWNTWQGPINGISPADSEYFRVIQEKTNVEIDFIASSGGKEQLSILIASDSTPDIIEEWWGNFPGGITKALADEVILPLNSIMEDGMLPAFTGYLATDPEVDSLCKTDDGVYYMLPLIRGKDSFTAFNGIAIRQDWLDDLNLDMPRTIDNWTHVLTQFKEQKGASSAISGFWKNFEGMVYVYGTIEGFYVKDNQTVHYGFADDNYRDYLEQMNQWMNLGILDPDLFTQTDDELNAKLATGKVGAAYTSIGSGWGTFKALQANEPEMQFVAAPNPIRDENSTFDVHNSQYRVSNISASISSSCENLEAACRVIDFPYTPEGIKLANYGIEGVSYEMIDGVEVYTELITNHPDGYGMADALAIYNGSGNKSFLQERNQLIQQYIWQEQKDALQVWPTTTGSVRALPAVTLTTEEMQEYATIMGDIDTYVQEMKLKFITGTEPIDSFSAFQGNLEKMNLQRAIEIQQAAFDRFLNR